MKTSVQLLTGALALSLAPLMCQGATPQASAWAVAAASASQAGSAADNRRQADDLLRQARKAIKEQRLDDADALIAQAEGLNVKYDPLTARFIDTPPSMRALLTSERSKASGPQLPSSRFPALLAGPAPKPQPQPTTTPPQDPFNLGAQRNVVEQIAGDEKSRAAVLLKDARAALAAGDKFAALAAWQKAAALPAQYGPNEDSPQRVAADLQAAGIDPSRLQPASASPTSPYMLRPTDIPQAADKLPNLGGPSSPPAAALPQGSVNPYNLPAENNPLAEGLRGGGAFQPVAPAGGPPPAGTSQFQPPPGGSPYVAAPGGPALPGADEPRRLANFDPAKKAEAGRMIAQARIALDKGDLQAAQQLAEQAQNLNIPDEAYAAQETRPWQLLLDVNRAMYRREGIAPASGTLPAAGSPAEPRYPVAQGLYDPTADKSQNVPASSQAGIAGTLPPSGNGPGYKLFDEGLKALENQDREGALAKFAEAWKFQDQLDPLVRQQLKDKLTFLRAAAAAQPLPAAVGQPASPLAQATSQQQILLQKLDREIVNEERLAEKMAENDPLGALDKMQKLRERVAGAEIDPVGKKQLLSRVDPKIRQLEIYIEQNKSTIQNDERNAAIRAERTREQEVLIQSQNKLAEMVEQFNKLMDEQRYPEAEIIARQARDLAGPNEPVVALLLEKAKLARNLADSMSARERKESAFMRSMIDIENSAVANVGDENPLVFDAKRWSDLSNRRRKFLSERSRLSPVEQEIQKSLTKLVEVKFDNRPLAEVMDVLSKMAGVNVYLDPQGLHAEGVTTDTPVSINLNQPVTLRSALTLILQPLELSYVIQNEVLRITSEHTRDSNTYAQVYYVADLVMPIPNFVPSYNIGLPGALRESMNALGYGAPVRSLSAAPLTLGKNEGQSAAPSTTGLAAAQNPEVLAQMGMANMLPAPNMRNQAPGGPGGMGGGVQADFDTLIELVTTTIAPQSWDEVGGPGSISGFDTNLSLVVSQTQEVHEQIADLLEQLRRLQDLQVTIEVRFITLSDRFFERIGVDFDFNIDDNTHLTNQIDQLPNTVNNVTSSPVNSIFDDDNKAIGIGWTASGPTADLDLQFNQGSFGSSTPQFGNFDANTAANFGFAILSDIEVYFVMQAAQGDDRTNILQAPKVTLFNGQQAFVSDTSQRPFVTSVIPVVGDFAAAHQPVIVVLNEGTSLSVQAVVSKDRRFVRLTLVPFFSQIGDVDTFTFNGSVTTNSGTVVQDPSNPDQNVTQNQSRTVTGTTVQLPTFAFTTVTTTVSVPDGGTVLLGGIKRLREGRNERGVPILSKVPYINRLFKNVGIGRDAQSLMMMVTPRIIIQEEEEEKLGIEQPEP